MFENYCPHQVVHRIQEVDLEALKAAGVRALLLDLDNTLTAWRQYEMSAEVRDWLARAQRDFRLCLVSNTLFGKRVKHIAAELGIPCVRGVGFWGKPWRRPFRCAVCETGIPPEQTAMIGDQLFTDICGARRMGMHAIMVHPIGQQELTWTRWNRKLARRVEAYLRRRGRWPQQNCACPRPGGE
jgi:hypothetical protein